MSTTNFDLDICRPVFSFKRSSCYAKGKYLASTKLSFCLDRS